MSELVGELLLRLGKAALAGLLAVAIYVVATVLLAEPASATLVLLSWLSGAALLQLLASSPL